MHQVNGGSAQFRTGRTAVFARTGNNLYALTLLVTILLRKRMHRAMEGQMSASQINRVLSHLRQIHRKQECGCSNDADLLERFLARQEEIAFEALVRRYGPMVLGVCRRVLVDHHDAEDAFQATFLVLVRKASSIRPRSHVGPWLYVVAYHTALQSRSAIPRQRRPELNPGPNRPHPPLALKIQINSLLLSP